MSVDEAIEKNILADYLKKNRAEVAEVVLSEYNEQRHLQDERQLGVEQGLIMKLIKQIRVKLDRGLTTAAIAEQLEEPENIINLLVGLVVNNPDADDQHIYTLFVEDSNSPVIS